MSNKIMHSGVIDSVADGCVRVRILQTASCAACRVASHCNASEAKEKMVDVFVEQGGSNWAVGQAVTVSASAGVAKLALWLGFGVPLLILVLTLVVVSRHTADEATAALAALAMLIPYYLVVWLFRGKIQQRVSFQIEEA